MENELSLKIVHYKKKLKMTNATIAEKTGLPVNTISRIASGQTKEPTLRVLRKLANAFDCTIDDLQSGGTIEPYYLNPEAAQLAQEVYKNPNLKILFDASRNLSAEDINAVIEVVKAIKSTKR